MATISSGSPLRQSRSLIDASERPLRRNSPGDPDRLEEWPVLYPQKPSSSPSPSRHSMRDGTLAIIEQLRSKSGGYETNQRANGEGVDDTRVSSSSSTGTVMHNTKLVEPDSSRETYGSLDDSSAEKSSIQPNGFASLGKDIEIPLGPIRVPISEKRSVSKELPQIRQTRTSSLRASLAASRGAESSPTAIALDRDGDHHRPIRGTRIPLKSTNGPRPASISQSGKSDITKQGIDVVVGGVETMSSERGNTEEQSPAAPSANDSVKRRSVVFGSTKPSSPLTPPSATLPRSLLPTASSAKKAHSAPNRHVLARISPFSAPTFDSNSLRSKKQPNRTSKSTLDESSFGLPSTQRAFSGNLSSDYIPRSNLADGIQTSTTKSANGSPKVCPSADRNGQFTLKRLSQADPDYGPTLKIHSSAERLIMGENQPSSEDIDATPSIESEYRTSSSAETVVYSAMATGRAQMMRSMSQLERDALKKRLQSVANSAEKRSNTKKEPVPIDDGVEKLTDRENKFRRDSGRVRENGNTSSNDRTEERKPLLEPTVAAASGVALSDDPFFKEKLAPNSDGDGTATFEGMGMRDFSDIAAPGKEAHWISPLPERRSSLVRHSIASTSVSQTKDTPELRRIVKSGIGESGNDGRTESIHSIKKAGKNIEASGALDSYTSASSSESSPAKVKPVGSPDPFPARKSSKIMVPDFTKNGSAKDSPPAPSFQHNPPKVYVERQNRLGASNGMESIEKGTGAECPGATVSKRSSVAEFSSKSHGSVSRSIKKHVKGLFFKGSQVMGAFRRGQTASAANGGSAKPKIGTPTRGSQRASQRPNTSVSEKDGQSKGMHKKTPSRPSILPKASPLPRMSQVHPVHRPRAHGIEANKASPMRRPRPLHKARTSSEPGNMFQAAMAASGRVSAARSGLTARTRHTMPSAWPLPPGVDPLSPAGLAAARVAQQQGRYEPRGGKEIEAELGGCSRKAQDLAARARRPECPEPRAPAAVGHDSSHHARAHSLARGEHGS